MINIHRRPRRHPRLAHTLRLTLLTSLLLSACGGVGKIPIQRLPIVVNSTAAAPSGPTRTPFQPQDSTAASAPEQTQAREPTLTPEPTQAPPTLAPTTVPSTAVWAAPYLPQEVKDLLQLPPGFAWAETPDSAPLQLAAGEQHPLGAWVYALVAPFPTIPDGVTAGQLLKDWRGEQAGPFGGRPILVSEDTAGVFSALWGEPAEGAVKILDPGELLDYAWDHRPAWAIVPFESLEPRWKVLQVDGQSPIWKEFDPAAYPLTVKFSLEGDATLAGQLLASQPAGAALPLTNRDPNKLTTLAMTGVTALVRATAFTMERKGVLYPGEDVRDILRSADLAHVSNEIPFDPDCPPPNPSQEGLVFCSAPKYIQLLEDIGTDIVELTGDHFADYGPQAMIYTLDLYKKEGWTYYGGGYDRKDARKARLIENNGNKLAFIGCNAKGGGYATAAENNPGAVSCDFDWMHAEIARLTKEGYLVIETFQHFEYYTYKAQPNQIKDSRGMAEAGAVIVSGSQAHQPQGLEFYKNALIHYGLGNLFFDQYFMGLPTSQGFIDRHVFYNGHYISTELIGIMFVDFARPRLMTEDERAVLLNSVFKASGW